MKIRKICISFFALFVAIADQAQTTDANDIGQTVNVQTIWSTNQSASLNANYKWYTNSIQVAYNSAYSDYTNAVAVKKALDANGPNMMAAPVAPDPVKLPTKQEWVESALRPMALDWLLKVDASRIASVNATFPAAMVQQAWANATLAQQTNWVILWSQVSTNFK